jgi:hypothetical protein
MKSPFMSMPYTIKNHPTWYKETFFRSRLEARWAAFFDLAEWEWQYEPLDLLGWSPDFRVVIPCRYSDCHNHVLLVEVKPYCTLNDFDGHPCLDYPYGEKLGNTFGEEPINVIGRIPADASAAFGVSPKVTYWEMSHGSGGGVESVDGWVEDVGRLWGEAGAITQYHPVRQ